MGNSTHNAPLNDHRASGSWSYIPRIPTYTPKPSPKPSNPALIMNEYMGSLDQNPLNRLRNTNNTQKHETNKCIAKYEVVAFKVYIAIDIGTDGSAIAFAYNDKVTVYNQWQTKMRQNAKKLTTHILSDDEDNIVAFGDSAKPMYLNLAGAEKRKWKLFERFKMSLSQESDMKQDSGIHSMNISSELTAINGTKCPAQKLFKRVFNELKQNAMEYLDKNITETIKNDEIQWIITVPAIWNEASREKMRQWIINAELINPNVRNQCRIVSDVNCAAIAIREIYHIHEIEKEIKDDDDNMHITVNGLSIDAFNTTNDNIPSIQSIDTTLKDEQYLLINVDGAIVDIVSYDITTCECIKHICYQSVCIDDMFKLLLTNIFGHEWIDSYIYQYPNIYLEIMDNFKAAVYDFSMEDDEYKYHDVQLPYEFVQFLHLKCKDRDYILEDKIKRFTRDKDLKQLFFSKDSSENDVKTNDLYQISVEDEMVVMDVDIWKYMFDFVMDKVIISVEELILQNNGSIKYMYLVGCFACSKYFEYRMRDRFESKCMLKVMIPDNPTMTVVLGAAYFGITKNCITAKKCKFSYGIRIYEGKQYGINMFNAGSGYNSDKIQKCFHVMVHKNNLIQINDTVKFIARCTAKASTLEILRSDRELPQFESEGEKLGSFPIKYDQNGEVIIAFNFGENTFMVYTYMNGTSTEKHILKEIEY